MLGGHHQQQGEMICGLTSYIKGLLIQPQHPTSHSFTTELASQPAYVYCSARPTLQALNPQHTGEIFIEDPPHPQIPCQVNMSLISEGASVSISPM